MDAAASDPFILDWGSSVNVNEDLRRSIRVEIEEIETDIKTLQSTVKAEEKISNHLTKDFAHARAELMNLSRGAVDDCDNSIMNEQIQMRLRDSLMMEVVSVITPPTSPDNALPSNNNVTYNEDTESPTAVITVQQESSSSDHSNERHFGRYLSKCAVEVKSLSTSMEKKKVGLEEDKSKLASIQYNINNIMNQVDGDQKTRNKWSENVDKKRRELDVEKQRIRCVKDAIQRARKMNGHHAQRIASDSKKLSTLKAQNADKESKHEVEKKSIEDDLSQITIQHSELIEKDSVLSSQLDNLAKQFNEREDITSKRSQIQQFSKEKNNIIDDLKIKKEDLKKKLIDLKEALQGNQAAFDKCKKQKEEVEHMKAQNDKEEELKLVPARATYPKLLEEKQSIAKKITELHDSSATEKHAFEAIKKTNTNIIHNLKSAYKEKLECVESKKADIEKIEKLADEVSILAKEEIEENEKLASNLSEAIKAQRAMNDEKRGKHERLKMTKSEFTSTLKRKSYELELLKLGSDIITRTREIEKECIEN